MTNKFLTSPDNEFAKLDQYDKRLFFEIFENHPRIVEQWIESIAHDYRRKDIRIDSHKFIEEVRGFREYLISEEVKG